MGILIINGPNLNLLGKRQPEIYGYESFEDFLDKLRESFPQATIHYVQSNHEGELIDRIQEAEEMYEGIILNPGGYSHTSVSLADAVAAISVPVIEVHISNIFAREEFRRHSYISPYCKAVISGMGMEGYRAAVRFFLENK